ncbi:MAG TPA: alpha/beta hydrolase [Streptosporangiaceae bacterium]
MGEVLSRPAAPPDDTVRYGTGSEQVASVWRPRRGAMAAAPVVMFLHGGFWRAAYNRTHVGPLAVALAEAGFLVCAPEYRRVGGGSGGGWPATFDDIAAAVDGLPAVLAELGGPGPGRRGRGCWAGTAGVRSLRPDRSLVGGVGVRARRVW